LDLSALNYLPQRMQQDSAAKSLALVKAAMPPLELRQELCTQCGICMDRCPMNCIRLNPYPQLGHECVRCLQCVRQCPEQAFVFDPAPVYDRLVGMAEASEEEKNSRIFA
jgi:NAD-dependent dihydropyrimidine dehydrogenase PreA subunit